MELKSQVSIISKQCDIALDIQSFFWQEWQQYREYLYRCCIKWMGNPTDAEDALSRAMLKALEKVQKYAGEIVNFKAWLTQLTRNLCVDIYRERSRGANRVEDIEVYASGDEQGLVIQNETPESVLEMDEKKIVIRRAIDELPTRLRETFILHFYEELSYPEIAEKQEISYQNVCKRISQARAILVKQLRGYFIGEDGTKTELAVTPVVTEPTIEEMSEGNAEVEAIVGEPVTLFVAIAEVESIVGEEPPEVVRDVQHSESVIVATTSDRKLKVKSDGYRCVEVTLCEKQPTPILALAILLKQLRGYLIGDDQTNTDSSVPNKVRTNTQSQLNQQHHREQATEATTVRVREMQAEKIHTRPVLLHLSPLFEFSRPLHAPSTHSDFDNSNRLKYV